MAQQLLLHISIAISCFLAAAAAAASTTTTTMKPVAKPNIVYVMTDDQDIELGGLTPMPKIRRRLGEQGAVGEAVYIATPICCPSRTETFSGRLYTNVVNNDLSGCMHVNSTFYTQQHSAALVPSLQRAGYMTGGFGKIINDQQKAFDKNLTIGWDWLSTPVNQVR
jgi:arylsulfatase A-like enzyme